MELDRHLITTEALKICHSGTLYEKVFTTPMLLNPTKHPPTLALSCHS
jgi:hypothetical protein